MSECRKCEIGDHEDCLLFDLDATHTEGGEAERLAATAAHLSELLEEAISPRPAPETNAQARAWLDNYYDARDACRRSRQAPAPEKKEKP